MPRSTDVAALIAAVGIKDFDAFRNIANSIVSRERSRQNEQSATIIETTLDHYFPEQTGLQLPPGISSFVWLDHPKLGLSDIYLPSDQKIDIYKFVGERKKFKALRRAGLPMRNRILLCGPPGNGKTTLAGAIAKEMKLPMLSLKSQSIIDSYIGKTSRYIEQIFDFVQNNNCLLFIDELDSIGSKRSSGSSGQREYNVIVNSLLMNLDRLSDNCVVIAATNKKDLIDGALLRRFNVDFYLEAPAKPEIKRYIMNYQRDREIFFAQLFSLENAVNSLEGKPWSRVAEFCQDLHRQLILNDSSEDVS